MSKALLDRLEVYTQVAFGDEVLIPIELVAAAIERIEELEAKYEAQVVQAGRYYAENKGLRDFLKDKGWDIAPVVWETDD